MTAALSRPRIAVPVVVVLAAMLVATAAGAKTTGIEDDPSLQSGPCYDALADKNAATPTTAPNRELGSACAAEQGDIDKAWARVIRLWGSDSADVPDYDNYQVTAAPEGAIPLWLSVAGLVLSYLALGTPIRAAARLMSGARGAVGGAIGGTVIALALRASIAGLVLAAFGLPGLKVACGVALVVWLAVGRRIAPPHGQPGPDGTAARPLAVHLAAAINDGLGAAAGLAALMLFVQHSPALLIAALGLALVASAGPIIAGRRALRSARLGAAGLPALLAGAIGAVLVLTPPVAGWAGGGSAVIILVPLVLAALTLAAGWRVPAASLGPEPGPYTVEGGRL